MSRVINFRAWHKELKIMLYPPSEFSSSFNAEPATKITYEDFITRETYEIPIQASMTWDGRSYTAGKYQDVEWLQYTGLTDKKGKKVYDGDILENPLNDPDDWERCVVKYYDKYARFGLEFYSPYGGEGYTGLSENISDYIKQGCYVIGNIYENENLITI